MGLNADDKESVLASANDLIAAFGGNASVDAFEAARLAYEDGDAAGAAFYLAVVKKIREIQGA